MSNTEPIRNTDDVIDSRDVIARIEYLKESWAEATGGDNPDYFALSEDDWAVGLGEDEAAELVALMELASQAEGYIPDWQYGETLISDGYFETYAREFAEDIGAIDSEAGWPNSYIDWEAASEALQQDYTELDFGGNTYWAR